MTLFYTGVGSRKTPPAILHLMRLLADKLASMGYTLRSGGAEGADSAFEDGATAKEIYRPEDATPMALKMAAAVHPKWGYCSGYAKRLHARNCFQVLGRELDTPSCMLICWTPDGATCAAECTFVPGGVSTGGTATAIRLAELHDVPVRNLARPDHYAAAMRFLNS